MMIIDTKQKHWQKQMEACMRKGERFKIKTSDKKLAKSLENGKFNTGVMKIILLGSPAAVGAGAGVVGLKGIAGFAGVSSLAAIADPEPVTKIVLSVIAGICIMIGAYYVYRLVKLLVSNKYKFHGKYKDENGKEWELEAEPA